MYLRHTTVRRNGKTHTYWRLVRSVRVGRKVRQETVAQLGELDAEGRAKASLLAKEFLGRRARQRELFEDTRRFEPAKVQLDRVRVERSRPFGHVWLAWKLWQALQLDEFCELFLPRGREKVPWPEIAAILVMARLCEPSSELHIAEDWYRRTALEDVIGVPAELVHHTRLYQGLDRLLQRNSRAAGKFVIEVHDDASQPSRLRVEWQEKEEWNDWARQCEGTYLLRSNVADWAAQDLWKTYVQLFEVEAAFRIHKTDLRIRPIWHQREDRVRAHILVCFLAYALWKTLQGWQRRARLGSSPRTVLEELARIPTVDVVLPLETGKPMRLRCVVRPEQATAILLDRLGLRLPKRLRPPPLPGRM